MYSPDNVHTVSTNATVILALLTVFVYAQTVYFQKEMLLKCTIYRLCELWGHVFFNTSGSCMQMGIRLLLNAVEDRLDLHQHNCGASSDSSQLS